MNDVYVRSMRPSLPLRGTVMIGAIAALLLCQLAGEILVRALGAPFPGPVAGLGLMFLFLLVRGRSTRGAVPDEIGAVPTGC